MHNIISAAIFAAIMAVLSQFTFPIGPVPITLQSFVCALAGGVLGRKWGAISIGVWLLLGLLGIPILTMGKAGAGIFFSPVGGYYLGFVVMAWISGFRLAEKAISSGRFPLPYWGLSAAMPWVPSGSWDTSTSASARKCPSGPR